MTKSALLLAALVGPLLAGCHRKLVPAPAAPTKTTAVPAPAGLKVANTSFAHLNGRGKVRFERGPTNQSANFNLRVRRDSAIWLSGSLLGIEGVRALLTPDSVRIVNRLEKTYFVGSYSYLSQLLGVPVAYKQVQAILLGDYLPPPTGTRPTVQAEADNQAVRYPLAALLLEQLLSQSTGRVQQLKISEANAPRSLTVSYADFQTPPGADLPLAFTVSVVGQQSGAPTTSATLNFNRVEVGSARLEFPFNVPKGYERQTKLGK